MNRTKEQWALGPRTTFADAVEDIAELYQQKEKLEEYNRICTDELLAATRRVAELEAERDALRAQVEALKQQRDLAQSNTDAAIKLAEAAQERANRAARFNSLIEEQPK